MRLILGAERECSVVGEMQRTHQRDDAQRLCVPVVSSLITEAGKRESRWRTGRRSARHPESVRGGRTRRRREKERDHRLQHKSESVRVGGVARYYMMRSRLQSQQRSCLMDVFEPQVQSQTFRSRVLQKMMIHASTKPIKP
jgi:hypothetical protein